MHLSRRHLLGGGLLGGLAWVTGTAISHHSTSRQGGSRRGGPPPPESPALGGPALGALVAVLEVLLPDPSDAPAVAEGVDRFLSQGPPEQAADLRLALLLLEHAGAGALGFSTFSALSLPERAAVLDRWQRSPLGPKRQVFHALRRLAGFAWYAGPSGWPAVGYDGPWVGR